jgi:hypothetical protein
MVAFLYGTSVLADKENRKGTLLPEELVKQM